MRAKIHSRLREKVTAKVKEALARAKPKIAAYIVDRLGQQADTKLHATAALYKEGLNHPAAVSLTERGLRVTLQGVARDLENGWSAFDMKKALLRSKNVKLSKKGKRYIDVTFRHGHAAGTRNFKGMPAAIQARVRAAIAKEKRDVRTQRVTGKLPGKSRMQTRLTAEGSQQAQVSHKTSIYSDMLRTKLKVGRSSRGKYETFRRVSQKSGSSAWWHPGFAGVRAIPSLKSQFEHVAKQIVLQELRALGVKAK